jgi:hypothetical protein
VSDLVRLDQVVNRCAAIVREIAETGPEAKRRVEEIGTMIEDLNRELERRAASGRHDSTENVPASSIVELVRGLAEQGQAPFRRVRQLGNELSDLGEEFRGLLERIHGVAGREDVIARRSEILPV